MKDSQFIVLLASIYVVNTDPASLASFFYLLFMVALCIILEKFIDN